jgi:hypothetical protein
MFKPALFNTLCGITLATAAAATSAATIGLMAPLSGPQALVGQRAPLQGRRRPLATIGRDRQRLRPARGLQPRRAGRSA